MNLLLTNLKKEEKNLKDTGMVSEALIARGQSGKFSGKKKRTKVELDELKKKSQCKWCNAIGHWWKDCPSRPEDQKPSRDRKPSADSKKPKEGAIRGLCAQTGESDDNNGWFIDSGASAHLTGRREWFSEYKMLSEARPVRIGNGEYLHAIGIGSVLIVSKLGTKEITLRLEDVHYVPKLSDNLFSIGAAINKGAAVTFDRDRVRIIDKDSGQVLVTGTTCGTQLFKLAAQVPIKANIARTERSAEEWHRWTCKHRSIA